LVRFSRDYAWVNDPRFSQDFLKIFTELDSVLLSEVAQPDAVLEIKTGEEVIRATRSLLLSQAVMHAAEHKGQIAAILKQHGHHIDLDDLDLWNFISMTKK